MGPVPNVQPWPDSGVNLVKVPGHVAQSAGLCAIMAAHCVEKGQPAMVLTDEVVTKYGMMIGIPVLLAFLFFIIWGLTKEADTGRFGKLMM